MTNDRRKTFATPLEFWQWAIQEPGKRWVAAHSSKGVHFHLRVQSSANGPCYVVDKNGVRRENLAGYRFVAVEDEHGVISPPEPEKCSAEIEFLWHIKENADRYEYVQKLIALIDERIVAATVEERDTIRDDDQRYRRNDFLRIQPKGGA